MKKQIAIALVLVLLFFICPAHAYSQFVFRDHIRWQMAAETVQLFEGITDVGHDKLYDFIQYKDVRVGKYQMNLEYEFVGNKLVSAVYSKEFDNGIDEAYSSLKKALTSVYGTPTNDCLTAMASHYSLFDYLFGIYNLTYSEIKESLAYENKELFKDFYSNVPGITFWIVDDTEIMLEIVSENTLMIYYFDRDTVTAEDDTTGL